LNKSGYHHAKAKEITDVGKMHVEIPTEHRYIIENSKARNTTNKSKGAINSLKNKLCCSVFDHNCSPFLYMLFY
jgi:hypothetical protein